MALKLVLGEVLTKRAPAGSAGLAREIGIAEFVVELQQGGAGDRAGSGVFDGGSSTPACRWFSVAQQSMIVASATASPRRRPCRRGRSGLACRRNGGGWRLRGAAGRRYRSA